MMPEEELNVELDDTDAMDFHYFKLHDYDNNNRLDGLELGQTIGYGEGVGQDHVTQIC